MSKKYAFLTAVLLLEFLTLSILRKCGIAVDSWPGNAIGTLICILPLQVLLYCVGHDDQVAEGKREFFKYAFVFVWVCYAAAMFTTLYEMI